MNFIDWVLRGERREEIAFAADPAAWIERLRGDGIVSMHLRHEAAPESQFHDHKLAGMVGGGGRWLIEARGAGSADYWQSRWKKSPRPRWGRVGSG